jgi:hypothetical protein
MYQNSTIFSLVLMPGLFNWGGGGLFFDYIGVGVFFLLIYKI